MLGDECDGIDALLAAHFAALVPGPPKCFAVATQLRAGIFVLLPAVAVATALGFFVMHAASLVVEARADDGTGGKLRRASLASALLSSEPGPAAARGGGGGSSGGGGGPRYSESDGPLTLQPSTTDPSVGYVVRQFDTSLASGSNLFERASDPPPRANAAGGTPSTRPAPA